MPSSLSAFEKWTQQNAQKIREDFFQFLRFKSVSTDPDYCDQVLACAQWVEKQLAKAGFRSEVIPTQKYPLVYGENNSAGAHAPTVLFYAHYDVQPVDPIELWKNDPFEPKQMGTEIYARGALDDKGQALFAILAFQMWKEVKGSLPINVKFCIEGEEECGSVGLTHALPKLKDKLRADYLMVVDCGLLGRSMPAITLGGRGIVTMQVQLKGSHSDLHSGLMGGIAYNPIRALVELLSTLWDDEGRVAIPHFYDDVEELTQKQKEMFSLPCERSTFAKEFGIEAIGGEEGRTLVEKNWMRPTLEINGISGGYTGTGFKTVIPATATAKISCRLVPHQNPEKIGRMVRDFLMTHCKKGIEVEVTLDHGGDAFRGSPESKLAKCTAKAYEEVMGRPCANILTGGSIPVIASLMKAIGAEVVGMGYGLSDDNMHAPNEHFGLDRLEQGILTVARTVELMGEKE